MLLKNVPCPLPHTIALCVTSKNLSRTSLLSSVWYLFLPSWLFLIVGILLQIWLMPDSFFFIMWCKSLPKVSCPEVFWVTCIQRYFLQFFFATHLTHYSITSIFHLLSLWKKQFFHAVNPCISFSLTPTIFSAIPSCYELGEKEKDTGSKMLWGTSHSTPWLLPLLASILTLNYFHFMVLILSLRS